MNERRPTPVGLRRAAPLAALLAATIVAGAAEPDADVDPQSWVDAARGGRFEALTTSEHADLRRLFADLLVAEGSEPPDDVPARLAALDLTLEVHGSEAMPFWLIREQDDARRGRGVLVIRPDVSGEVLLQLPHARSDLGTGRLGAAWLRTLPFRAGIWNTVRRADSQGAADQARAPESLFTAMAEAALDVLADPVIVQVHGFAADRRRTAAGARAQAIVSSGKPMPDPPALAIAACLQPWIPATRLYGLDVDELGGTINPVGRRTRERGSPAFVHIELEAGVRSALADDAAAALEVGRCLLGR